MRFLSADFVLNFLLSLKNSHGSVFMKCGMIIHGIKLISIVLCTSASDVLRMHIIPK